MLHSFRDSPVLFGIEEHSVVFREQKYALWNLIEYRNSVVR